MHYWKAWTTILKVGALCSRRIFSRSETAVAKMVAGIAHIEAKQKALR